MGPVRFWDCKRLHGKKKKVFQSGKVDNDSRYGDLLEPHHLYLRLPAALRPNTFMPAQNCMRNHGIDMALLLCRYQLQTGTRPPGAHPPITKVGQDRIYAPYMTVYFVFFCQNYTVYIWFWPTLPISRAHIIGLHFFMIAPKQEWSLSSLFGLCFSFSCKFLFQVALFMVGSQAGLELGALQVVHMPVIIYPVRDSCIQFPYSHSWMLHPIIVPDQCLAFVPG